MENSSHALLSSLLAKVARLRPTSLGRAVLAGSSVLLLPAVTQHSHSWPFFCSLMAPGSSSFQATSVSSWLHFLRCPAAGLLQDPLPVLWCPPPNLPMWVRCRRTSSQFPAIPGNCKGMFPMYTRQVAQWKLPPVLSQLARVWGAVRVNP